MAIGLENFEQVAGTTIAQRGRTYFRLGRVLSCVEEEGEAGAVEVEAVVQGTERYMVRMTVDENGTIHGHRCSCPYDGELCKHEVAVLYYLRERRKVLPSTPKNAKSRKLPHPTLFFPLWRSMRLAAAIRV